MGTNSERTAVLTGSYGGTLALFDLVRKQWTSICRPTASAIQRLRWPGGGKSRIQRTAYAIFEEHRRLGFETGASDRGLDLRSVRDQAWTADGYQFDPFFDAQIDDALDTVYNPRKLSLACVAVNTRLRDDDPPQTRVALALEADAATRFPKTKSRWRKPL